MNRWPILALICLALCGCQSAGGVSEEPCPSNNLCGDTDTDTDTESRLLPGPAGHPMVARAEYQLLPGCPSSLQVMAWTHPIVYRAVRPDDAPEEPASDQSDSSCEGPEPALMRASRRRDRELATR
jgi:hypothetical protein